MNTDEIQEQIPYTQLYERWIKQKACAEKAEAELNAMIEQEASVCPEDFGCVEYISILQKRIKELEEQRGKS